MLRSVRFVTFFALGALLATGSAADQTTPPEVARLVNSRDKIAADLVGPAVACFQRLDTEHAVFKGCIDWHSAAHGAWAILAYTRATGDRQYLPLVQSRLTEDGIRRELEFLRRNPEFEMPYGRAWFLRLAIEHRRIFGESVVQEMARSVSDSLLQHYLVNPPDPNTQEYDNSAWALINLLDYATETRDEQKIDHVRKMVAARFMQNGSSCSAQRESRGFMAVCANWAWLVSKVQPRPAFLKWYEAWKPNLRSYQPIVPRNAHEYGLNFSRAWGLWEVAQVTGDRELVASFARHFSATYDHPDHYRGDYRTVAHWVAQFGMFAAMPLFGPKQR